jgi:beta-galactosidase
LNLNEYEVRWSVTSDGEVLQSGVLNPVDCEPGKQVEVKIPVEKIQTANRAETVLGAPIGSGEYWLRVSFHTRTNSLWSPAGYETAWEQMQVAVSGSRGRSPHQSEGGTPRRPEIGDSQSSPLRITDDGDTVRIEGTNFAAAFSRSAGTLTSLVYDGREMLASDKKVAQASCPPNASGQAANSIIQRQAGRRRYFRAGGVGTLRGFTGTNASFLLFRPYPAPGASDR